VTPLFLLPANFAPFYMTHPLIPQIIELAKPIANNLGLEVVGAVFHTNQNPPVLRVDIRNLHDDTGLEDCEKMSRDLEAVLETNDLIPGTYVLEVSSPGISRFLTTDREFISFKGFTVIVSTKELYKGQKEWAGQLISRDEIAVHINQKGRVINIPRDLIEFVTFGEE
jgi:ribosome maturation factor RimP